MKHVMQIKQTARGNVVKWQAVCSCGWKGDRLSNLGNAMAQESTHAVDIRRPPGW